MLNQSEELTSLELARRNKLKESKPLVYEKVIKYKEKFDRGESIAIVQFQYDYTCNFRCQHCSISSFQHKKSDRFFKIEDVRELSRQLDEMGLARIDVTGGEPLVFPDLDQLIEAIDPAKFFIQCDSNGWLMTDAKAQHLKDIGVDKVQLSIDNLYPHEHDDFRRRPGSHERVVRAIDSIQKAGLGLHISTVATHQRIKSEEFIEFLEFAKSKCVPVSVVWPKLVGEWEGKFDILINQEDIDYLDSLRGKYDVFEHLTPGYGIDAGCLAVKRMISITKYGDVMPCPWMYFSLGNFFKEPMKDIVERGMKTFGKRFDTCLVSNDRDFINKYVTKTYGKELPVPIEEIITDGII